MCVLKHSIYKKPQQSFQNKERERERERELVTQELLGRSEEEKEFYGNLAKNYSARC